MGLTAAVATSIAQRAPERIDRQAVRYVAGEMPNALENRREKCAASLNAHEKASSVIEHSRRRGSARSRRAAISLSDQIVRSIVVPWRANTRARLRVDILTCAATAAGVSAGSDSCRRMN